MPDVSPHLALPLRLREGRFVSVDQGSTRHLQDQAEVVVRTRPGTLEDDPEFGLRNLVATLGPVAPEVLAAVHRAVPARFAADEDETALAERVRSVALDLAAEDQEA